MFPFTPLTATWTFVELQLTVSVSNEIQQVCTQHHFEQQSSTLFRNYIAMFFDIKKKAAKDGNVGLKEVAKLII